MRDPSDVLPTTSLEALFDVAQQYGNVDLFQNERDRTFSATITFQTIKHAELKAKSGFNHPTPRAALQAAIAKAEEIVASIQQEARRFGDLRRIGGSA